MRYFFVLGTDKRTKYIKEMLEQEGKIVEDICLASFVILPTPFSKDGINITGTDISCVDCVNMCKDKTIFAGAIPKNIKEEMEKNNIKYYDLMEYDDVAILNAIPTAEGAIKIAIEKKDFKQSPFFYDASLTCCFSATLCAVSSIFSANIP